MIKISTVICGVSLVAAAVLIYPNVQDAKLLIRDSKQLESQISENQLKMSEVSAKLCDYQEKYKSLVFNSNLDIANAVNSLKGVKLQSITALAEIDGKPFECAEVSSVSDVSFFNEETKQMSFKLKLTDEKSFISSLKDSGLVVSELTIDREEKKAILLINSVFSTTSASNSNDEGRTVQDGAENGMKEGTYSAEPGIDGPES